MATKNIKKLSYDLNALMEDFKSSLGLSNLESTELYLLPEQIESKKQKINSLLAEKEELLSVATDLTDGISVEELSKIIEELSTVNDSIIELLLTINALNEIKAKDENTLTEDEREQIIKLNEIKNEILLENKDKFEELMSILKTSKLDEISAELSKKIEKYKTLLRIKNELELNQAELEQMETQKESLEVKSVESSKFSLENFEGYLEDNGFSTAHAEDLFNHYVNPQENPLKLETNSIKIRKTHPKRDAFIKKFAIPTAITAGAFGLSAAAITAAKLVDGSSILGLIPISQTPGLTVLATGCVAGAIGVIATPLFIIAKDQLTKLHYNVWYKDAKTNLNAYENGTNIESLYITKLIEKIKKTKRSILEMNQGNWFTKLFKFIPKHILNAVNRNRIHHLEAYTKDLMTIYANRENNITLNNDELRAKKLQPVYDLLRQVEDFIADDIAESKVFSMLTCKKSGKHTHKSTIENIDIFASLKMYVDAIAQKTTKEEIAQAKKSARAQTLNISQKTLKAGEILNNEDRLITRMLNYNARYAPFMTQRNETIDSGLTFDIENDTVVMNFDDEGQVDETLVYENSNNNENITAEESTTAEEANIEETSQLDEEFIFINEFPSEELTETNEKIAEEQPSEELFNEEDLPVIDDAELIEPKEVEEPQPVKHSTKSSNLIKKLTQRLKYSSTALTHSGKIVGVKLVVDANGNKSSTEIRYMSSKNKIRIKTSEGEKFVPVTDTIIPPMNQMNEILQEIASEQHIDNASSLTID